MAIEYLLLETTGIVLLETTGGVLLETSVAEPRPIRINTSQGWRDIGDDTAFVSGSGTPTAAVGATGAIYLNTATGLHYGPKAAGAWPGTALPVPAGTPSDATTSAKGVVQLAGDLAGTAALPQLKVPYGTTLPASPADGQEAILVDSTTNPNYQWRFRYNAASTSPYKWGFIGGSPWMGRIDTNETTTSASFADLTTTGPQIALPRAGVYELGMSVEMTNNGTGFCIAAPAEVGVANYESLGVAANAGAGIWTTPASLASLAVTGSLTVKLVYRVTGGTGSFQSRSFSVRPIRV
jgi:hypothetical protein